MVFQSVQARDSFGIKPLRPQVLFLLVLYLPMGSNGGLLADAKQPDQNRRSCTALHNAQEHPAFVVRRERDEVAHGRQLDAYVPTSMRDPIFWLDAHKMLLGVQ